MDKRMTLFVVSIVVLSIAVLASVYYFSSKIDTDFMKGSCFDMKSYSSGARLSDFSEVQELFKIWAENKGIITYTVTDIIKNSQPTCGSKEAESKPCCLPKLRVPCFEFNFNFLRGSYIEVGSASVCSDGNVYLTAGFGS